MKENELFQLKQIQWNIDGTTRSPDPLNNCQRPPMPFGAFVNWFGIRLFKTDGTDGIN